MALRFRDYTSELTEVLTLKDPGFQPHHLQFWNDNVIKRASSVENSFQAVDDQLVQLDKDARASAFRQDALKLTRDCAQLAQLYQAEAKHERSMRIQKVSHLKAQNVAGANYIKKFMSKNARHVAGRAGELEAAADEFINDLQTMEKFKTGGMICWVDFTKSGKISPNELNDTLDLVQSILGRLPTRSCAFVIAPHLISDRVQNGLRGEIRTGACEMNGLGISYQTGNLAKGLRVENMYPPNNID